MTIEQTTYDILHARLTEHARDLRTRAERLNAERVELFGSTALAVIGNERIRTENNCVPRDIVTVGDKLLFGYNVFIGLRSEVNVQDVLSLHGFAPTASGFSFERIPDDHSQNFLADPRFVADFKELYRYYKETRLLQLRRVEGKLLAIFQTGAALSDLKVFRWTLDASGQPTYVDNRGERDHVFPPSHDFEWTETTRDHHVLGRFPHVSILDSVFVETVGGDLTIKIENNTESGQGIYSEPVDEKNQSLADASIFFAKVGNLILLKILPYNEKVWRYLVFSQRNKKAVRLDAIGQACLSLPEDHGIIFPGGALLDGGELKTFEGDIVQMIFKRAIRSPNGEDVAYLFYEQVSGRFIFLPYNLIRKEVAAPIHCNGLARFDDGKIVIFRASAEPTRIHPMQVWQTPFVSDLFAAAAPAKGSFLEKVGNADLVRGISDSLALARTALDLPPSEEAFEDLIAQSVRINDAYHWLKAPEVQNLFEPLEKLRQSADGIVAEYVKVETIKKSTALAIDHSASTLETLFSRLRTVPRQQIDQFVTALGELRSERGKLISLRELRYADLERIAALEKSLIEKNDALAAETVRFLLADKALEPYRSKVAEVEKQIEPLKKTADAKPLAQELDRLTHGLELLTEVVGALKIDDPTERTRILEQIAQVLGSLNRARALLEAKRKDLISSEGAAEFGAQLALLAQSVSGTLNLADTPEKCDEQLARLLLQLEELEGKFGEVDAFLEQLSEKREDIYEAFSAKKQMLVDERQRRAGRLMATAERIFDGIRRRAATFGSLDELNAYFVADPMVGKLRDVVGQLRAQKDSVKADELESRIKAAREEAGRALRDRIDLFESGADGQAGQVIRLGQHRFSVNTQPFDLTLLPRAAESGTILTLHLTGTDFAERIDDPALEETRDFWEQTLISETGEVYRGEFLAASILAQAEQGQAGLSIALLHKEKLAQELGERVRIIAGERFDEGYARGQHDVDATAILEQVLTLYQSAGLLRFPPRPRALACLFWAFFPEQTARALWQRRAKSLARLRTAFNHSDAIHKLSQELAGKVASFCEGLGIAASTGEAERAGAYLFEELASGKNRFETSAEAMALKDGFQRHLELHGNAREFEEDLRELQDHLAARFHLTLAWLEAFLKETSDEALRRAAASRDEAAVLFLTERRLERQVATAQPIRIVEGLLGQHARIKNRQLELRLDEFLARTSEFRERRVPGFRAFHQLRHKILAGARERLRLDEFKPKVMSAFVRNQLIDQVYLPLIGHNLAKQLGTVGENKRVDQMGLLLLVSPPGYGKTTLMEYVAHRLGLVFVKVNGPALGHEVKSLDPVDAPNATARQEVEKINLALEMGNNVLLYLDDIQHTNAELLQKFISLCDAQRRIEGVWQGRTRTYDLRGKRFAICMAGNPYTESGAKFKIPDMLANRADTYNLGDILQGKDETFALSFIENALTSNSVLQPLASRDPQDLPKLVRMAQGEQIQLDQLQHAYAGVELEELQAVLRHLLRIRAVLLEVNKTYISSAAQDDQFRTEPRFQLQGSYRNMNKMAEKVVAVMNEQELESLIDDHYRQEAQTLTTGAEHNLLKLAELRGQLDETKEKRWSEIKRGFARVQSLGGAEDDPATRMIGQLSLVSERLQDIDKAIHKAGSKKPADIVVQPAQVVVQPAAPLPPASAPVVPVKADDGAALAKMLGPALVRIEKTLVELISTLGTKAMVAPAAPPVAPAREAVPAPLPVIAPVIDLVGVAETLAPYLERLDQNLRGLASAPRGAEVVQTLGPGVYELLERLGNSVNEALLPLVQGLGKQMKAQGIEDRRVVDRLDRTLKNLDLMRDLVGSLRKIDTRVLRGGRE